MSIHYLTLIQEFADILTGSVRGSNFRRNILKFMSKRINFQGRQMLKTFAPKMIVCMLESKQNVSKL